MQNFYDSTIIRPLLTLDVSMKLSPIEQCWCIVTLNDTELFSGILQRTITLEHQVPLLQPLNFKIAVQRQHPQAVVIDSIQINNKAVMPLYRHLSTPPTNYIDFNGDWTLSIPSFYEWYHETSGQGWII